MPKAHINTQNLGASLASRLNNLDEARAVTLLL